MNKTKGFITVATGNEEYFVLANNLLKSYHYFCDNPLPFAVLTDRSNRWTANFDDVIVFPEGATNSYLDKLKLGDFLPYDINIFIDSDCLAFGNLNNLFEYFSKADDFSCFGRVLPLEDRTGWFEYENLGELRDSVTYIVGLHGGIYYMRKGTKCNEVFRTAQELVPDYHKYKFKGKFLNPGDEPLIALSMALHSCHPIPFVPQAICCYWEHYHNMKIDISCGEAVIQSDFNTKIELLHWGTRYTREIEYKKQVRLLDILVKKNENKHIKHIKLKICKIKYDAMKLFHRVYLFCVRGIKKIRRTFHF